MVMSTKKGKVFTISSGISNEWDSKYSIFFEGEDPNFSFEENIQPGCCALTILDMFAFSRDAYYRITQNDAYQWRTNAKSFIERVNQDRDFFFNSLKTRVPPDGKGGLLLTLANQFPEDAEINNFILEVVTTIYGTPFIETLQVRSNHGNYPISQYAAVLRYYYPKEKSA